MVIAVRHDLPEGDFYVLRTSLETKLLDKLLSNLEISGEGDAFVINREGILQTSTRRHGDVLESLDLEVPEYSETTRVYETLAPDGVPLIVGYSYIPSTPFILMIVKQKIRADGTVERRRVASSSGCWRRAFRSSCWWFWG